jgi:hypothetical protein
MSKPEDQRMRIQVEDNMQFVEDQTPQPEVSA